jgi:dihydroxyacid dehydratase/phosphogluconate dehydratase
VPDRKLRSNFTPGTTPWAMRRAQWSALGLSDEDLEKPKIAIVNSSSQLASCFSHLDEIVAPLYARTVAPLGAGAVLSGAGAGADAGASSPDRPLAESPSE